MNKINFQDLPNETTPINANNLNQLQTNVDNAKYELTRGTAIPSGADLDDYKTNGSLYCESSSKAGTLSNCPIRTAFKLIVENISSSSQVRQTIIGQSTLSTTYIRTYNGSEWGYWYLYGTQTIQNENGEAIKFLDGTMICRFTIPKEEFLRTSTVSTTIQGITVYRSLVPTHDFPVAFIDTNIQINVSVRTGDNGARATWHRISSISKSSCSIQLIGLEDFISSAVGYTNLTEVHVTAIGKWK